MINLTRRQSKFRSNHKSCCSAYCEEQGAGMYYILLNTWTDSFPGLIPRAGWVRGDLYQLWVWFGLCCLMTPGLCKGIRCHVWPHFFIKLQMSRADIRPHIKWVVSLVIAYGHFDFPQRFVWVCMWVRNILTLSLLRVMSVRVPILVFSKFFRAGYHAFSTIKFKVKEGSHWLLYVSK